jgi:hypothetical protein
MAIGQLLHANGTTNPDPTPYFTPWTGRGGNSAVFVVDVIALNLTAGGAQVVITVQTKNSEDPDATDASQDVGSFDAITTLPTTPLTKYLSGFEELVRYKITVKGSASDDWVHMRMLAPSWLRN